MSTKIYLDESGDLGWTFDKPYQYGGSSRYLTLAASVIPFDTDAQLARTVRGFYKARRRGLHNELKSVDLSSAERLIFANKLVELQEKYTDIRFVSITVSKQRVNEAFRKHPNGLYNYMAKLLLLPLMQQYSHVTFIPDTRTVRTELKHALGDYLRTELAIAGHTTELDIQPGESKNSLPLQFSDYLAGIVWAQHEFKKAQKCYQTASPVIDQEHLFFKP